MTPEALLRDLERMPSLASVVPWVLGRTSPGEFVAVVVQDEFTHDVVVRLSPDLFVVFDTT